MVLPVSIPPSALNTSVKAIQKEEARFAKAANDLTVSFAANANEVSGITAGENQLEAGTFLATAEVKDPAIAITDMLSSEHAFKANLEAFKAASELEDEVINMLKRDV